MNETAINRGTTWLASGGLRPTRQRLGLAALLVPVSIVMSVLFQISGQSGIMSFFLLGIIMLIALAFQLLIFGVQYCAFREVFNQQVENDEPLDPDSNDHQLVA